MMKNVDIRPYKNSLREKFKKKRREMSPEEKKKLDLTIAEKLFNLWQYREENIILTYVSTDIEVDTIFIIKRSFEMGKTVAVPRCIDGTHNMDFYIIKSFDDLENGSFGVLEPKIDKCEKLTDFSKGLCIVPALVYDKRGYRLGYGKGYYDRFLSNFKGQTVGISYNFCLIDKLPNGKFDRRLDKVITQNTIINTKDEEGS